MKGAIFLDRDGTINVQARPHHHITCLEEFHFLPGALDALAFLGKNSERQIVIVTNQSCIGRGTTTREQVAAIHQWMVRDILHFGGHIAGIYVCPHRSDERCACRKPQPGLLLQAAKELDISLADSVMVGDTGSDIQAAWNAGIYECYAVLSGRGKGFPRPALDWQRYETYADLEAAAHAIVRKEQDR